MPTWAGIIRISHLGNRQVGSERLHSDRDQERAIRAAVPPGHSLELLPPEYDVSGGLPLTERPALGPAVLGVETGRYAGIIVAYHSRLFRNLSEEEAVYARIEQAGGEIILALDPIDNRTVDGRLLRRIRASMNVAERERQGDIFEQRCAEATKAGIWQRRQTPTGYAKDPTTRKLIIDPAPARKVHRAFTDRLSGKPISTIAHDIGMTPSGVRALLRNRVYLGELRVRSYVNTTAHDAIIEPDLFDAVQHARVTRPPKASPHPALLAGIARCAGCGHVIARTGVSYSCSKTHSVGVCPAPAAITARILNEHVERIALHHLASIRHRSIHDNSGLKPARERVAAAQRELDAYLEAVDAAGLSIQTYAAGARKRQDALEQADHDYGLILAAQSSQIIGDPVQAWDSLNDSERNHVLSGLLEAVMVRKVGRGRSVPVGERVRVIRHGTEVFASYRGAGRGMPHVAFFPDLNDPCVLGVPGVEDARPSGGG